MSIEVIAILAALTVLAAAFGLNAWRNGGSANKTTATLASFRERVASALAVAWVAFWFVASFAAIFSLSAAQQFQERLREPGLEESQFSVGYTLTRLYDLNSLIDEIRVLQYRREAVKQHRERIALYLEDTRVAASDTWLAANRELAKVARLSEAATPPPAAISNEGDEIAIFLVKSREWLDQLRAMPIADWRDDLDRAAIAVDDLNRSNNAIRLSERQLNARLEERAEVEAELIAKQREVEKNFQPQFRSLLDDLASYRSIAWGVPFWFVSLPSIVLTLALTVFMGVLGSLIAITREMAFESMTPTLGQVLFRTGLGAAVALAIFFFAGAGVLTLAQTTKSSSSAVELGPYLVSFLAIISGFLSRRVSQWIRETGEKVFTLKNEPERWGRNLSAVLERENETVERMTVAMSAPSVDQVKVWMTGETPIPLEAQLRMAAFLRTAPSELFTDIAPRPAR